MSTLTKTNRRNFLKMAATAGGGLMLGFHWSGSKASAMEVIHETALVAGEINFNLSVFVSRRGHYYIFAQS